jgi:hypothetical protein
MATIEVLRREVDGETFPTMCMRCGADTERLVSQTFSWMPGWVYILLFCGILPWLIVSLVLRKSVRVMVPMCDSHVNHWRNRILFVWVGLFCWVISGIVFIAIADDLSKGVAYPITAAFVFGILLWLIVGLISAFGAIRASEISNFGLELINVNRDFAREWRIECEDADKRRRSRKKRKPRRDDEWDRDDDSE